MRDAPNRKNRLRMALIVVAALGSSAASLSGALAAFAFQQPPAAASGAIV